MISYQELNGFLSEKVNHIFKAVQKEATETQSPVLKQYVSMLREAQDSIAAMHTELLKKDTPLEEAARKEYYHLFNLMTDIISEMEAESSTLIGKKHMLALKELQIEAEEQYLQLGK